MGKAKFDAAAFREAASIKTISAKAELINGKTIDVPLKVLRGDDALAARKRVFREATEVKAAIPELAEGAGADLTAITEEQLMEAGRVQEECYRDIIGMVVVSDTGEPLLAKPDEWDAFAKSTGGRDSDFGAEVYRAAGLTHPREAERKREVKGGLDHLPFLSRGKRG